MRYNFFLLLSFLLLFAFSGCRNKGSTRMDEAVNTYIRYQLNGDWYNGNNVKVWRFNYDSIYYYDKNKTFAYRLDSLNLSVRFDSADSFKYLGWVVVQGDSLLFNAGDSIVKLYRQKQKTAADLDELLKRTRH
jgi:hypothetical protein